MLSVIGTPARKSHDGLNHVVGDRNTCQGVAEMIADAVTTRFNQLEDAEPVWIVILRTAAEKHVVIHVFSDTFVAVERMKLPASIKPNSETVDGVTEHQ